MFPTWEESPESQAGVHYRFPTRVGSSGKLPTLGRDADEGDRLGEALELDAFLTAADLGQQRLHRRIVGHGARQHDVAARALALQAGDRKSVVEGKSVRLGQGGP